MKRIFPSAAVGPENLQRERGKFDDKLTPVPSENWQKIDRFNFEKKKKVRRFEVDFMFKIGKLHGSTWREIKDNFS